MIRAAVFVCAFGLGAGGAAAQQSYYLEPFEVQGQIPDGYGSAISNENFVGQTYNRFDGQGQLVVSAGPDLLGGLSPERDIARAGLQIRDATITSENVTADSFAFAGREPSGWNYVRYTRFGETCDGRSVTGTFVLRYAPDAAGVYDPQISRLSDHMSIGGCG